MAGENQLGTVGKALPRPFEVVVTDANGNFCENTAVRFEVIEGGGNFEGAKQISVSSNGDGRAAATLTLGIEPGTNSNVVDASFDGLPNSPAKFRASGVIPGPESATRFVGVVLDNENIPLPEARVRITNTVPVVETLTDGNGQFVLTNVPSGSGHLFVDASTTTRSGTWPALEFEIDVIPGIDNTVGMPIFIPLLDESEFKTVGGDEDVILKMKGIEGLALKVFKNSVKFPDGSITGVMGLSQVSNDQVPMPPIGGVSPPYTWTFQPMGTKLNPPAQLTVPNAQGLSPGAIVDIVSFDHDLGQFISVGTATVQPDGATIVSDPGSGLSHAGWGYVAPPPPPPGTASGRLPNPRPPRRCQGNSCNDGKPCNGLEFCNPLTNTCVSGPPLANGVTCDDGDANTVGDQCAGGTCVGAPNQCLGQTCGDTEICNGIETCDPVSGCQPGTPLSDGTACNDGVATTTGDRCESGVCVGFLNQCVDSLGNPVVAGTPCDDGNSCTIADQCFAGACQGTQQPDGSTCDDGNSATFNDICQAGNCAGNANQCLNGNGQPLPAGTPCDDGNTCTDGDQCFAGVCGGSNTPAGTSCDDGNSCTENDVCATGGCNGLPVLNGTNCDDGNPATQNDICVGGTCVGGTDGCIDGTGMPLIDGTLCSDADACTNQDICLGGMCSSGLPISCSDDGDICNGQETCNSNVGCESGPPLPDQSGCNDGQLLTDSDQCKNGTCGGTVMTKEVTVIGYIDGAALEEKLQLLRPLANPTVVSALESPVTCAVSLGPLTLGASIPGTNTPTRRYLNVFLLRHSPNATPQPSIHPDIVEATGDFRLFLSLKVSFRVENGKIVGTPRVLKARAKIGKTPEPCIGADLLFPFLATPETNRFNGILGVTPSKEVTYILAQGRVGVLGQTVDTAINDPGGTVGSTTPWIYFVLKFDALGNPILTDRTPFPSFRVYADGALIATYPQLDPEPFISLDSSNERKPSEILD